MPRDFTVIYRAALERIAARGVVLAEWADGANRGAKHRCSTCCHWWDDGETPHHDANCAHVIASAALADSSPSQGGGK